MLILRSRNLGLSLVCVCLHVCAVCEKYKHVDTFVRVSEPE